MSAVSRSPCSDWGGETTRLPVRQQSLTSRSLCRSVRLNGDVLKMLDHGALPDLTGRPLPPSDSLQLPAFSLAFFILADAQAAGCV